MKGRRAMMFLRRRDGSGRTAPCMGLPAAAAALILLSFPSCNMVSSFLHDGDVAARVGQVKLYKSEVAALIPAGTSSEDSLRLARQYINLWAMDEVALAVAQQQLSKEEKDVSREVESYRRSLLKYNYEQHYVNQRLDTEVTEAQVEEYYLAHRDDFILPRPIAKVRYAVLPADTKQLDKVRRQLASDDPEDWNVVVRNDDFTYAPDPKYIDNPDRWFDTAEIASDMDAAFEDLANVAEGSFRQSVDRNGRLHLVYFAEVAGARTAAPVDWCSDAIAERIISLRKKQIVSSLEQSLLDDARQKGKFIVY